MVRIHEEEVGTQMCAEESHMNIQGQEDHLQAK